MANRIILSNNRNDRKIQVGESIVLNAYTNQSGVVTGGAKDQSGCYITPIRDISGEGFAKVLYYDPATFEVGYTDSGDEGGTVTSVGISSATLGISGSPIDTSGTIHVGLRAISPDPSGTHALPSGITVDQYGRITSVDDPFKRYIDVTWTGTTAPPGNPQHAAVWEYYPTTGIDDWPNGIWAPPGRNVRDHADLLKTPHIYLDPTKSKWTADPDDQHGDTLLLVHDAHPGSAYPPQAGWRIQDPHNTHSGEHTNDLVIGYVGTITGVDISSNTLAISGSPIDTSGTIVIDLSNTAVLQGNYKIANISVDRYGRITDASNGKDIPAGWGTVTSVGISSATLDISGVNPIDGSGIIIIDLSSLDVSGSFTNADITVDEYGRITAASSGTDNDSGGTITHVGLTQTGNDFTIGNPTLTGVGGDINIDLKAIPHVHGTFTNATITVDTKGRITAASSGTAGSSGPEPASPTQTIDGNAHGGHAPTFMRSDAAPALANTTVTAGSYTNADITVDAQGRITDASNGTAGDSSGWPKTAYLTWTGDYGGSTQVQPAPTAIIDLSNSSPRTPVKITFVGGGGAGASNTANYGSSGGGDAMVWFWTTAKQAALANYFVGKGGRTPTTGAATAGEATRFVMPYIKLGMYLRWDADFDDDSQRGPEAGGGGVASFGGYNEVPGLAVGGQPFIPDTQPWTGSIFTNESHITEIGAAQVYAPLDEPSGTVVFGQAGRNGAGSGALPTGDNAGVTFGGGAAGGGSGATYTTISLPDGTEKKELIDGGGGGDLKYTGGSYNSGAYTGQAGKHGIVIFEWV